MIDPRKQLQAMKNRAAGIAPNDRYLARVRALQSTLPGFDRSRWRQICQKPGLDPAAREFRAMAAQLGAELAPEPVISAAMAASLLPAAHLASLRAGERIILPAWQEATGSIDPIGETTLRDGRLAGCKQSISMAEGADAFLVTTADGLALVERDAPGVSLEIKPTQDGGHLGVLTLHDAPAEAIDGDAGEALERAILGHCFYLFGLMDRALKIALNQANAGSAYQALRNRGEDMRVQVALTRETINAAANVLESEAPLHERQSAVSRAKIRASDAAVMVTRTCVQLHTGTGSADLSDLDLFQRKAAVMAPQFGSAAVHRARLTR